MGAKSNYLLKVQLHLPFLRSLLPHFLGHTQGPHRQPNALWGFVCCGSVMRVYVCVGGQRGSLCVTLRVICVRLGLCACVCVYLCTHTQPLPPGFKKKVS